jgi:histidinol-phosphate aminotransferase
MALRRRGYYRQFDEQPPQERNAQLHAEAEERRRQALERVDTIDLSQLTWPQLPPSAVVNAVTYAARRGLHRAPDAHAGELRSELAHRHQLSPTRLVLGNGAAQLMGSAVATLMGRGDELVTPWPSYPLLPLLARRVGGSAVPVSGFGAEPILRALTDRTRIVALCNPNDPTGEWMDEAALSALLDALPERVVMLLDEALVEYAPASAIGLVAEHPRLLVLRSFSKAWGLAGLRIGYAIGGPRSEPVLERLAPELGVGELSQVGALEALHSTEAHVGRRVEAVRAERERLTEQLRSLGLELSDSEANLLWVGAPGMDGAELATRLERGNVRVAGGGIFGDPDRVRVAVQSRVAGDRLVQAMTAALARPS